MEGLCPADLFHYHGLLVERRTRELRELLNVSVAAAAVTVDKGEAYRKLDDILDGGGAQGGGGGAAGGSEETWQPVTTPEGIAAAAAVFEEADRVGKRR